MWKRSSGTNCEVNVERSGVTFFVSFHLFLNFRFHGTVTVNISYDNVGENSKYLGTVIFAINMNLILKSLLKFGQVGLCFFFFIATPVPTNKLIQNYMQCSECHWKIWSNFEWITTSLPRYFEIPLLDILVWVNTVVTIRRNLYKNELQKSI